VYVLWNTTRNWLNVSQVGPEFAGLSFAANTEQVKSHGEHGVKKMLAILRAASLPIGTLRAAKL